MLDFAVVSQRDSIAQPRVARPRYPGSFVYELCATLKRVGEKLHALGPLRTAHHQQRVRACALTHVENGDDDDVSARLQMGRRTAPAWENPIEIALSRSRGDATLSGLLILDQSVTRVALVRNPGLSD